MTTIAVSDMIGIPFVNHGRDVHTGLDCYGLLIVAQSRFGNAINDLIVDALDTASVCASFLTRNTHWQDVSAEKKHLPGDVVALAIDPAYPDITQHFGTIVDDRYFLHTLKKTGSILSRMDHPFFAPKTTGYFRWQS